MRLSVNNREARRENRTLRLRLRPLRHIVRGDWAGIWTLRDHPTRGDVSSGRLRNQWKVHLLDQTPLCWLDRTAGFGTTSSGETETKNAGPSEQSRFPIQVRPPVESSRTAGAVAPFRADRELFRAMRADGRFPEVGTSSRTFGARLADIMVEDDRIAHPGRGGLSVSPDAPANLPDAMRPRALNEGRGRDPVWKIRESLLSRYGLAYRPDPDMPDRHGFIEPASPMSLDAFHDALAATQESWSLVSRS
jgi:hypothetical protein